MYVYSRDEEGFFEEVDISLRYRELYDNRGEIEIKPTVFVKFQPTKLGALLGLEFNNYVVRRFDLDLKWTNLNVIFFLSLFRKNLLLIKL